MGKTASEYLVTGGAGFIGSNLCSRLVADGRSVRVLDNLQTGRRENLDAIMDRIDYRLGDIRNPDDVVAAVKGVRFVIHMGALPSVPRSIEDPFVSNQVNVEGTLRLLLAARDAGVERFVFSSSSSVYGDTPTLPKREDMTPCPLSPYAGQKLMGELYGRMFFSLYGLKTISLRYFNVFGPRQNPRSQYAAVIPKFIESLLADRAPVIYGDGEQTRDFTFVDDVVEANLRACAPESEAAAGQVFNVARGDRISVNRVAATLADLLKKPISAVHEAARSGEVRDSQADSTRAREMLGWQGRVSFEDGLRKTCAFFHPSGL